MTQIVYPTAVTGAGWTGTAGDLSDGNDATVVQSPPNPEIADTADLPLAAATDPETTTGHALCVRAAKALDPGADVTLTVEERNADDDSLVATRNTGPLTSEVQTFRFPLTAGEVALRHGYGAGAQTLRVYAPVIGGAVTVPGASSVTAVGSVVPITEGTVQVGEGFTDGSMRQIVRTSGGTLYTVAPWMNSYQVDPVLTNPIRVYRSDDAGVVPAGFTRVDQAHEPQGVSSCACAIDGSDTIHIVWAAHSSTTTTRYLRYAPFSTTTNLWGSVTTILSNLDHDDIGQGDEEVAAAVDAAGKVHLVFLSASSGARRIYYTNNVSGSWAAATQVDADVSYAAGQIAWHPGLCFDANGRAVVSWLRGSDNNDANTDGVAYVRTRETAGTWNASVAVLTGLYDGIDQCISVMVTADNRYHLGCSGPKSGGWQAGKYLYSDDGGTTWTANHPAGVSTHNVTIGPGVAGAIRLWFHGTGSPVNLYYVEGAGGSAAWGTPTQCAVGNYDCSVNARWSQYHHAFPTRLDVAFWNAVYPNALWMGGRG